MFLSFFKNKSFFTAGLAIVLFFSFLVFNFPALAALGDAFTTGGNLDKAASVGYNTGEEAPDVNAVIAAVIRAFLSFFLVIFVIMVIYGGFLWMSDRGNDQQIEKAKKLLEAAFIGIVIVSAAYALTYFVVENIVKIK